MKFYISFGAEHSHVIDGLTYDENALMLVEAPGELAARVGVNKVLRGQWSSIYDEDTMYKVLHLFPRGVLNTHRPVEIFVVEDTTHPARFKNIAVGVVITSKSDRIH